MRGLALALLCCAACERPAPAPATAKSRAVDRCAAAFKASKGLGDEARLRFTLRECAEVYSKRDCRAAMPEAADGSWPEKLQAMVRRCAAEYCPALPAPKPSACTRAEASNVGELLVAMQRWEFGDDAMRAGEVVDALRWPAKVVDKVLPSGPPPRPPIPLLELKGREVGFSATLTWPDGGTHAWDLDRDHLDPLRAELESSCEPQLLLRAERELMFSDLKAVMLAVTDGGCHTQIDFAVAK